MGGVCVFVGNLSVRLGFGREILSQTAVDPLYGVALVFGDDSFLDVGVDLLVHEILQLGQVII